MIYLIVPFAGGIYQGGSVLHGLGWLLSAIGGADLNPSAVIVTDLSFLWAARFWHQLLLVCLLLAVTCVIAALGQQWLQRRWESRSIATKATRTEAVPGTRIGGEATNSVRPDTSVANRASDAAATCSICYESYDGNARCPRILSCGHTYCQHCLTQMRQLKRKIECPMHCKDREPVDSVTSLVKNYALLP